MTPSKVRPNLPAVALDEAAPMRPDLRCLRCARCARRADTAHVVPWIVGPGRRVELACPRHDPGGYWFELREYFTGPPDWRDPSRPYTMRILDTKVDGATTVELLDAALTSPDRSPA